MMDALFLLGGISAAAMLLAGIWYLLQIVAYWKIFTKAGKPGWHSLIPFLNIYDQYDLSWSGLWGLIFLALTLIVTALTRSGAPVPGTETLVWVLSGALVIVEALETYKLSKAFGHGIPFAFGLFFLTPFFMLWLGFGDDAYRGRQQKKRA